MAKEKIIFVAHPYHKKTKSCDFLVNYLKKFYDVEVLYNNSKEINENSDLSPITPEHKAVIFLELFPIEDIYKNIQNDNIIFFPMYDMSFDWKFNKWLKFKNIKIVNFSKTLNKKHSAVGLNSMYIQYFIEPKGFTPGDPEEVFFWQRRSEINIETVKKMLPKNKFKIHIHTAVDPDNEFFIPSKKDETDYNITYSDWFESKEEMNRLIKNKGIYVAPREYEGIGISFLEAMAQGKAVVANDAPTMNEYIQDGKTGYLVNFKKTKKINLSKIEQVQKNAYEYAKAGHEKWLQERSKIIDFINEPPQKREFTIMQRIKLFLTFADKKDYFRLKFGSKGYLKILGFYLINKGN